MIKVWVRCRVCNKKIRIKKEYFDKNYYILSEGVAVLEGDRLYFYCDKHNPNKVPLLAH
ncbi:MAG: hypothetical protein ACTSRP_07835 [Candidatus Helarchaeota archaeon]